MTTTDISELDFESREIAAHAINNFEPYKVDHITAATVERCPRAKILRCLHKGLRYCINHPTTILPHARPRTERALRLLGERI